MQYPSEVERGGVEVARDQAMNVVESQILKTRVWSYQGLQHGSETNAVIEEHRGPLKTDRIRENICFENKECILYWF